MATIITALTVNVHDLNSLTVEFLSRVLAATWAQGFGGSTSHGPSGVSFEETELDMATTLEDAGYIELAYTTRKGWSAVATTELVERHRELCNGIASRILKARDLHSTSPEAAEVTLGLMA